MSGIAQLGVQTTTNITSLPASINVNFDVSYIYANVSGSVLLPDATTIIQGRIITIKREDAFSFVVNIVPFGAQTIDGTSTPISLQKYQPVTLVNIGTGWTVQLPITYVRNAYDDGNNNTNPLNLSNMFDIYLAQPTVPVVWVLPIIGSTTSTPVGRCFNIRNSGAAIITLTAGVGNTIEGAASIAVGGSIAVAIVATTSTTWKRYI